MPTGEGDIPEACPGFSVKHLIHLSLQNECHWKKKKSTDKRDRQDREVKGSSLEESIEELRF